jgi:hypothetical protein
MIGKAIPPGKKHSQRCNSVTLGTVKRLKRVGVLALQQTSEKACFLAREDADDHQFTDK